MLVVGKKRTLQYLVYGLMSHQLFRRKRDVLLGLMFAFYED